MKIIICSVILLLAFAGCDVTKKREREVAAKNNPWYLRNYTYADGSGNLYTFNKDSLEYLPVKPRESSSGTYDGGDHVKIVPDLNKFFQVVDLIEKAHGSKADHAERREMGTGSIRMEEAGTITAFMLLMDSPLRAEIENLLAGMRKNRQRS